MSSPQKNTTAEKARAAAQQRTAQKVAPGSKGAFAQKNPGQITFYSDETPGLKVSPKTVLITSLVYIGIVVILHLYSKLRQDSSTPADL
mmetsp:Transcript_32575/g.29433  ORF Transcript_32575/g.29433 Transcript_32575/m.29433 type:complete len:89 (+) Transcript_32575:77-343(+)